MVTSVCFGGADRRDLYIVTGDNTEVPERAGTIYRTRADVPGVAVAARPRLSHAARRELPAMTGTDLFDDIARWQADAAEVLGLQGIELVAALSPGAGFPALLDALAGTHRRHGRREPLDRNRPRRSA